MSARSGLKVICGGLLPNIRAHATAAADCRRHYKGDRAPGLAAPLEAEVIDAADRLPMPGLINAHIHGLVNLAKGTGDHWTLESLLNAGPYLAGNRALEDKYLSSLVGGIDMIRSGCTACYDLFYELPVPSLEELQAAAQGYCDVGLRALLAPMVADRSFYEAMPGLLESASARTEKGRRALSPGAGGRDAECARTGHD